MSDGMVVGMVEATVEVAVGMVEAGVNVRASSSQIY